MTGTSPGIGSPRMLVFLVGASAVCLGLLAVQVTWSGNTWFSFLAWNLFLAGLPVVLAAGLALALARRRRAAATVLAVLWVLFLPNAPYMVTDFVHVGADPPVPVWFDAILFSAFASLGLVFGLLSITLAMGPALRRARPAVARTATVAVLAASAYGIFLGRFEELNSWDLLVRPASVARVVLDGSPSHALGFTAVFTAFLIAAFAVLERLLGRALGRRGRAGIRVFT